MALIGRIRKNPWILLVGIGLGLGGFIFMDMTSGQQSAFGGGGTTLGVIEGEKLDVNDFINTERFLYRNASGEIYSRRNALWNYFVEETLVQKEAESLGLGVSDKELMDLQFGQEPSPVIRQRFSDPSAPGQINRDFLNNIKTIIEGNTIDEAIANGQLIPEFRYFWKHQQNEIIKDRLQTKMNEMVSKAMFTPTWMAEMGHQDQNLRVDFSYVKVPFDELDNSEVVLEDADYASYLKGNEKVYYRKDETRQVEYVTFNILPTAQDSANLREELEILKPEFEATSEDFSFVQRNFGSYDSAYVKKDAILASIADTVSSLPTGATYGPYIENNTYKLVKLVDRITIPDSVRSRHILIQATPADPLSIAQAQSTVDSLKGLIEAGTHTFDSLATAFGTDATRDKGGDLGYTQINGMVKPFNDLIFFSAEEGKLYSVVTQFGVHLVEVTGRKYINNEEGVKLAYLSRTIIPSPETQAGIYDNVLEFVGQNRTMDQLTAAVDANPALNLELSPTFEKNDFSLGTLAAGTSSRNMVRWAFNASIGDVSPDIYSYQDPVENYDNKYVVAGLKAINSPGVPSVASVKDEIELQIINQKKGEMLLNKMQGQDMATVASTYNTTIDTATNVNFDQAFVQNLGAEPKVLAAAFNLEQNQISAPVVGETGVFIVKMVRKPTLATATNIPQLRNTISQKSRSQVAVRLLNSVKENADIKDNRFKFDGF